jgi:endogenous inhibitor of DNA gyrase (YacG/DUF329 family)
MKMVKCPNCKKETSWTDNPYRPFCSENCKNYDLGKWANEEYRVPVEELDSGLEVEDVKNSTKKDSKD